MKDSDTEFKSGRGTASGDMGSFVTYDPRVYDRIYSLIESSHNTKTIEEFLERKDK